MPRTININNNVRYPHLVMGKDHTLEKRYSTRSERVHNGDEAFLGQYPFVAHVQMVQADGSSYVCTGSIVSNDIVVTAAHCIEDADSSVGITVRYGILNWREAPPTRMQENLFDYRRHEYFTFNYPMTSDIAYVRLDRPLDFSTFDGEVNTITIDSNVADVGAWTTFIGWGGTTNTGSPSDILYYGSNIVVPDTEAWDYYGSDSFVGAEFFCIDSESSTGHSGTCGGDSGGPAISDINYDSAYLWGATSFGSAEGCEHGYSCFTDVPYFRDWLTSNTGEPL